MVGEIHIPFIFCSHNYIIGERPWRPSAAPVQDASTGWVWRKKGASQDNHGASKLKMQLIKNDNNILWFSLSIIFFIRPWISWTWISPKSSFLLPSLGLESRHSWLQQREILKGWSILGCMSFSILSDAPISATTWKGYFTFLFVFIDTTLFFLKIFVLF